MTRYEELEAELDGVIEAARDYSIERTVGSLEYGDGTAYAENGNSIACAKQRFEAARKQFLDLLKISLIDSAD